MDPDDAAEFLRTHHHAVLMTLRADGRPQASPVVVALDGAGRAVVSTREGAAKVANVRRRAWASLCVFTDEFFGEWVQLEGPAHVLTLPEAEEPLVQQYRAVAGEHPDWEELRRSLREQRRVLLRIVVERAGPGA
ncbi:MAG: PPOX class F420-dependent oxidoreductase, partial [Acidimicrobiales bacterium]